VKALASIDSEGLPSYKKFTMNLLWKTIVTTAPAAIILIRLMLGLVFISEGIQKFLFPSEVGAGRFAKIGIPSAEMMAPFVGVIEIVSGTLILLGLLTRLATIPLIIDMVVAILSTKIPILLGHGFWGFSLRNVPYHGFWGMMHEMRTDMSMLLGSILLLVIGAGAWSIDARLMSKLRAADGRRRA
jgi:putative oxidoreductase